MAWFGFVKTLVVDHIKVSELFVLTIGCPLQVGLQVQKYLRLLAASWTFETAVIQRASTLKIYQNS